jgi:hypothetical protein
LHADRTIGPVLGKDEEREESDSFEYEHGYRLNEITLQGLTIEFFARVRRGDEGVFGLS